VDRTRQIGSGWRIPGGGTSAEGEESEFHRVVQVRVLPIQGKLVIRAAAGLRTLLSTPFLTDYFGSARHWHCAAHLCRDAVAPPLIDAQIVLRSSAPSRALSCVFQLLGRRRAASPVKMPPTGLVQSFALTAERYVEVVRNLGKHVTKSEHSSEERELVRAMLGGHGIVFTRDGRVGAGFDWAGLAQIDKTLTNQLVRIGSGGRI
jgi:hypothetical protein